ncbi:hypothetical protein SK128_005613 [Halocaridina rubra]|uniref:Uncharacterized protein n=1 Tax=Halocaridina rubra TaxID=373956 RepID=A0AAN9ACT0_HALRR
MRPMAVNRAPLRCGSQSVWFNEFASLGIQALEDIHIRAQYELYGDVLLMTNAIKNSLKVNPSGQPSDGPMGISVALTPSTTAAPLSKTFITNASFRTKKLPEGGWCDGVTRNLLIQMCSSI